MKGIFIKALSLTLLLSGVVPSFAVGPVNPAVVAQQAAIAADATQAAAASTANAVKEAAKTAATAATSATKDAAKEAPGVFSRACTYVKDSAQAAYEGAKANPYKAAVIGAGLTGGVYGLYRGYRYFFPAINDERPNLPASLKVGESQDVAQLEAMLKTANALAQAKGGSVDQTLSVAFNLVDKSTAGNGLYFHGKGHDVRAYNADKLQVLKGITIKVKTITDEGKTVIVSRNAFEHLAIFIKYFDRAVVSRNEKEISIRLAALTKTINGVLKPELVAVANTLGANTPAASVSATTTTTTTDSKKDESRKVPATGSAQKAGQVEEQGSWYTPTVTKGAILAGVLAAGYAGYSYGVFGRAFDYAKSFFGSSATPAATAAVVPAATNAAAKATTEATSAAVKAAAQPSLVAQVAPKAA